MSAHEPNDGILKDINDLEKRREAHRKVQARVVVGCEQCATERARYQAILDALNGPRP